MVINVISLMYLINDADRYYSVSVAEKIRLNGCLIVSLKKKNNIWRLYTKTLNPTMHFHGKKNFQSKSFIEKC